MTNHHTGGMARKLHGYIAKLARQKFPEMAVDNERWVKTIHRLGHYFSTRKILKLAGIAHIANSGGYVGAANTITLSEDAKLRFSGMPAGTARCNIAYEAAKRLSKNKIAIYTPNFADYASIADSRAAILLNRA